MMRRSGNLAVIVVLAILAAAAFVGFRDKGTTVTAYFTSGAGLYAGDDVRVIGIKVGTIKKVEADGDRVKVELKLDGSQPVPADAKAAIVAPSLVSGRFVQLTPAYSSGPQMKDGTEIPVSRTAVPVSFDDVKKQLNDLSTALGPGNKTTPDGALKDAINTVDANLGGTTAGDLRTSLAAMRKASTDLSEGRGDLFTSIKQLNEFTANLVVNDSALRGVSGQLATFSSTLDDNKSQLGETIKTLALTLKNVEKFVRDNTDVLDSSVKKVGTLSTTVAGKSDELAQLLQTAPGAVEGLYNTVDNSAVSGRTALANLDSTASLVCGLLLGAGGNAEDCRTAVDPLLDTLGLGSVTSAVPPAVSQQSTGTSGNPLDSTTKSLTTTLESLLAGLGKGLQ